MVDYANDQLDECDIFVLRRSVIIGSNHPSRGFVFNDWKYSNGHNRWFYDRSSSCDVYNFFFPVIIDNQFVHKLSCNH